MRSLEGRLEGILQERAAASLPEEAGRVFEDIKTALNTGERRAASKCTDGRWVVNLRVKQGILPGFRMGLLQNFSINHEFRFFDKHTFPLNRLTLDDGVRLVPGGSPKHDGAHLGRPVICVPPMFIDVGAYVDDGTVMICMRSSVRAPRWAKACTPAPEAGSAGCSSP